MLLAEAGCVFMGFILYISGVQGRANSICALKGSSVHLPCSAEHPTSSMKWFNVYWDGSKSVPMKISADTDHVTYKMSRESNFTLTISDLRESDAKFYCCREDIDQPENCERSAIQLHVADLQVKVIPTTEGQTVTLMCSTSCPLTEKPATYIWYKNGELLYQDWSPWYQQLVSSEEAVTYSCAIKGYEDLRAPEVSVDSVTSTCFSVTYAKGRMCSYKQTSVDEPCSITYPREIHVQRTPEDTSGNVRLTCNTSCPLTAVTWYKNRLLDKNYEKSHFVFLKTSTDSFSCAVKDHKDLHSAAVCAEDSNCWSVNYVSRRICALKGSSVNISSEYSHPNHQQPNLKLWYKIGKDDINSGKENAKKLTEDAGQVKYHDNMKNHHILMINNLRRYDSAEYRFSLQKDDEGWKQSDLPGVTLVVTGLRVTFNPSEVVTEGQRVTLTCSTSCPLPDNTNYVWHLNSQPLTLPENQTKRLVLDPVGSQDAGSYSCAVKRGTKNIISSEKTFTVHCKTGKLTPAAAAGVCALLLVIILISVFWWIRRKRTSRQSQSHDSSNNMEQLNPGPVGDQVSDRPTEQDDIHYSKINFSQNHTDLVYSTVQPHQPQEQEHPDYAVVKFTPDRTPEHKSQAVDP